MVVPVPISTPQHGLRQGDPLSHYLFILCVEVFFGFILKAQQTCVVHGLKIARSAPEITHLFYVDDSLLFCRETQEKAKQLSSILANYQNASGQRINHSKSEITFINGVPGDRAQVHGSIA